MPKYDAFGREIGEDTLASWRTGESGPAVPTEEPPADAEPAPRQEPAARPEPAVLVTQAPSPDATSPTGERVIRVEMPRTAGPPRPRRRPRVVSRLIVLIVLIAVGTTVVANVGREIEDAIREVPGFQVEPEQAGPPPAGLQTGSLIRPGELRRALGDLRSGDLGRVQHIRLAPERIDAALLDGRGTLHHVQLRHDGGFDEFSASRGLGHLETIAWNRLDPKAPSRLVRRAARRLEQPVGRIDYLVPVLFDGRVAWYAYFKGGAIFQGDAHGRLVRRVS
jgi:hypothetical protein